MEMSNKLAVAKAKRDSAYNRKGISFGIASGVTYGINGAIIGGLWYWGFSTVLDFNYGIFMMIVPLIFMVFNDTFAAIFLTAYNVIKGRGGELISSFKTKPGKIMMLCGLIGGPGAQGFYYMGFGTDAAGFAGPLSALYCVFGVLLGYFILHQVMNKRIWAGVLISVLGAIIIGVSGITMFDAGGTFYLGIALFLIAAVFWGAEGSVAAYGTPMIDPNIAINMRFITSASLCWIIFVGVFALLPAENGFTTIDVFVDMIESGTFLLGIASGIAGGLSYLWWYTANNMIGCGRGMALNISYSGWVPIISSLIILPGSAAGYFAYQNNLGAWPFIAIGVVAIIIGGILVSIDPSSSKKDKMEPNVKEAQR